MPVAQISLEAFSLLVAEARRLEVSIKDLLDLIVFEYFSIEAEGEEEEGEEEEESEEED